MADPMARARDAIIAEHLEDAGRALAEHCSGETVIEFQREPLSATLRSNRLWIAAVTTLGVAQPLRLGARSDISNPRRSWSCARARILRQQGMTVPDPRSRFPPHRGYGAFREQLLRDPVSWECRGPIALWREASTGQPLDDS
jgi:hypothetical protein